MAFRNPLTWPPTWQRADRRHVSQRKAGWETTIKELDRAVAGLGLEDVQISTDQRVRVDGQLDRGITQVPADPGVAIYFKRGGNELSLACDLYTSVVANLRALGLALEYFRRMENDGTAQFVEKAFTGFKALPEGIQVPLPHRDWWVVLGVSRYASPQEVKTAYREMMGAAHPDAGGSQAEFDEVRRAYQEWRET